MRARRISSLAALIVLASQSAACAVRTTSSEHYFGPVLFRSMRPPQGRAHVHETRHFGVLFESGTQWGILLGFIDRIAAAPLEVDSIANIHESNGPDTHWTKALGGVDEVDQSDWQFSLLHLRGGPRRRPEFLARTVVGSEIGFGAESRAVSIGYSRTAVLRVPDDQICALHFISDAPLAMRFERWKRRPGEPPEAILQPKGD